MKPRFNTLIIAVFCLSLLAPAGYGVAQEEGEEEQRTKRVEAMSERVHRRLSEAIEAMNAEDYVTAESLLSEVLELRNLSPYERAQANRYVGFVHYYKEDYPAAIRIFLEISRMGGPEETPGIYEEAIRFLSQLYLQVENYREAIRFGEMSLELMEDPLPMDYVRMAQAHVNLEQWREALDYLSTAIDKAQATGVEVKESWWRSMVYAHWELEQFPEALDVTKILLAQWPKKVFWTQISGLYGILEDEPRQLAAYWCAYEQGMFDKSSELVSMAQLFLLAEIPYKAAVILDEGLESGSIEQSARNYRLAAQAWQLARDDRRALGPMRKAAESEEDVEDKGELYVRLAETYNVVGDHGECASAARRALNIGELKSEGRTNLLLGQCLLEQEKFDEAGDAFERALRESESRREATRWQNYLQIELKRRQELEASLARYAN